MRPVPIWYTYSLMISTTPHLQSIVLGGGCFWCLEAAYKMVEGIEAVVSGYAGGHLDNPTYERVSLGSTGHAEVVMVTFDPGIIDLPAVLEIFWGIHDPTTPDRQGPDVGPLYRSIILYSSDEQKRLAEASREDIAKLWPNPVVTEIVPLEHFYEAESYHQNYFRNHPEQGYCQVVINPKLAKFRQHFASRIRKAPEA